MGKNSGGQRFSSFHIGSTSTLYEQDMALISKKQLSAAALVRRIYKNIGMAGVFELRVQLQQQGQLDEVLLNEMMEQIQALISKQKTVTNLKVGSTKVENLLMLEDPGANNVKNMNARSEIVNCIIDSQKSSSSKTYTIKLCNNEDRYKNEVENYFKICGRSGSDGFVKIFDYGKAPKGGTKIVMEKGDMDLQMAFDKYLYLDGRSSAIGPVQLDKSQLKGIFRSMAKALATIHSKRLVWTDLKLENFILVPTKKGESYARQAVNTYFSQPMDKSMEKERPRQTIFSAGTHIVKAIDLESVVKTGAVVTDFSPQVLAPEQVRIVVTVHTIHTMHTIHTIHTIHNMHTIHTMQFDAISEGQLVVVGGTGKNTEYKVNLMEPLIAAASLDVWAMGICILELYLGRPPLVSNTDLKKALSVIEAYIAGDSDLGLSDVKDAQLQKLLRSMLNVNPTNRPSVQNVLRSLYFLIP